MIVVYIEFLVVYYNVTNLNATTYGLQYKFIKLISMQQKRVVVALVYKSKFMSICSFQCEIIKHVFKIVN